MKLVAEHFDGFTEFLLGWTATIIEQTADVDAKWLGRGGRCKTNFKISLPELDIADVAFQMAELKPRYDGRVDDFPHHILTFTDNSDEIRVSLHAGIEWPAALQDEVDTFYRLWKPIAEAVESHPSMPRRT